MKLPWPGTPGGYVPVAYLSLIKDAAIRRNAQAMHQKQVFYSNVKDAQSAARTLPVARMIGRSEEPVFERE